MNKVTFMLTAAVGIWSASVASAESPVPPAQPAAAACCGTTKTCTQVSTCVALRHRLCDWLTYQPLNSPGPCECRPRPVCCCQPPLYAYFLGNCATSPTSCCAKGVVTWDEPAKGPVHTEKKPFFEWRHPLVKPFHKETHETDQLPVVK